MIPIFLRAGCYTQGVQIGLVGINVDVDSVYDGCKIIIFIFNFSNVQNYDF